MQTGNPGFGPSVFHRTHRHSSSRGIRGGTALPQSRKLSCQRRAPLGSPRQHLQSRGHPVLTLDARGHRGASATPPSSRLLPMRLCPPPKISCSPAVPSPATPRSPGSSASTRSGSGQIPRQQRGKGTEQPPPSLTPRLPPPASASREQRSPAVTSVPLARSVPEGELWVGFIEQRPSTVCDTPSAPLGGGSGGHAGFRCCCCLMAT